MGLGVCTWLMKFPLRSDGPKEDCREGCHGHLDSEFGSPGHPESDQYKIIWALGVQDPAALGEL